MREVCGHAVLDRAGSLRDAARLGRERAQHARTRPDRAAPRYGPDRAGPTIARIVRTADDRCALVEVTGVVDIASGPELTAVLTRAVDGGPSAVIVDLSAVTLLAAAGIGWLEDAHALLTGRGGGLHLIAPAGSPAARALRLLDLYGCWPVHPDAPSAVATVGGPA